MEVGQIPSSEESSVIRASEVGDLLGSRMTLLQFSSAFCAPCRTTRLLLSSMTDQIPDVKHIDVDAESHLELVRRLKIHSTPTTIVLDSDGREITRAVGVPKREQVLNLLEVYEI